MPNVHDILNEQQISEILKQTQAPSLGVIESILQKSLQKKGLSLMEVGYLLHVDDSELSEKLFRAAKNIKREIYGERLVLFAPLYISNFCVNDCAYCGFRRTNKTTRKKLTLQEVAQQVKILQDMGHKRLLLEFGEHPIQHPIDYVLDVIRTVYKVQSGPGDIRRVNVNIAATSEEDYRKLKKVGIGTYQLFQETYHMETYRKLHKGPKAEYERQMFAHNRAFAGGIDDVGLGVLFGLHDFRFEVLSLIAHAQYLEKIFGVGPHTISVPRWQPACGVTFRSPYLVSDQDFLKLIAILRLSVPYTGMIISTRESADIRNTAFDIGISQTSAASCTSPGGYGDEDHLEQFSISDERSVDALVLDLLRQDLLPSFCTACYRKERTGKSFMALAKPGNIQTFCRPNAILTFQEYLEDYASSDVRRLGNSVIEKYVCLIDSRDLKKKTRERLQRIQNGERDLYF